MEVVTFHEAVPRNHKRKSGFLSAMPTHASVVRRWLPLSSAPTFD